MKKPQCPSCQSFDVRFRATKKSFICRRCGAEWNKVSKVKREDVGQYAVDFEIKNSSLQKEKGSL